MREWYYNKGGQQVGPVSQEKLVELIKTNDLSPETYIWTEGMAEWGLISKSPFAKLTASAKKQTNASSNKSQNQDVSISENGKVAKNNAGPLRENKPIGASASKTKIDYPSKNDLGEVSQISSDKKRKAPKAYAHSGNYPANATFLVPLISMLPLLIISPIYAVGTIYVPTVYLNIILTIGFGIVSGFIVQAVGKVFKVRHSQLQYIFAALVGIFAISLSWFFWVKFLLGAFIFSPITMMQAISLIAEKGTWGIGGGSNVSGVILYLLWLIEAVVIIVLSIIVAKINSPFCERCDEWIETSDTFSPLIACSNKPALVKSVMSGDFDPLKSLGRKDDTSDHYTKVILTSCFKCSKMHLLSVIDVVEEPKKDGEGVKTTQNDVLENILIDYQDYKLLKNNWK